MNHLDPPQLEDEALRKSFPNFPEPLDALDDANMLVLVDALELDDGITLPPAAEHDMLAMHPTGVPASQQPSMANHNDIERMKKIRARNREAQARYRQKVKVCCTMQLSAPLAHLRITR